MWIKNSKNGEWINLMHVMRISKDGQGGYIVAMADGIKTTISQDDYDLVLKEINPEEKIFDLEKELEEIKNLLKKTSKKEGEE